MLHRKSSQIAHFKQRLFEMNRKLNSLFQQISLQQFSKFKSRTQLLEDEANINEMEHNLFQELKLQLRSN